MQVTIEPGNFGILALLQVQHCSFQNLRQHLITANHQQCFLQAQRLDHTLLVTTGQAQLPLPTSAGRSRRHRCLGQQRFTSRCRLDHLGLPSSKCIERIIGKRRSSGRRPSHACIELADLVQGFLDLGQQLFVGERLADKVGNAGLDSLNHVFLVATTGDHDERHCLEIVLLSAPGEQFKARQLWHLPITQHQIKRFAREQRLGFATIDRVFDNHAGKGVTQTFLYQVADKRGVIHNQYTDFTH
ncbi:hypothetical protein D3C76_929770 [compost metagenome]